MFTLQWNGRIAANCSARVTSRYQSLFENLQTCRQLSHSMPLPDFRIRSPSWFAYGNCRSPRRATSATQTAASRSLNNSITFQGRTASGTSKDNRRVVNRTMICAGSLRVRSYKLWKPAALQLMVTTTTARHYSLVFCHRSLMGYAYRERIKLNDAQDPVKFNWGKDGLMSARFEFSLVYGEQRHTLTCRASNAKEYLQWTEALRTAMSSQEMKCVDMNQAPSKASSKSRIRIESFFDARAVKQQQQFLEQEADIADEPVLKLIPAAIAAAYAASRRRQGSALEKLPAQSLNPQGQRREHRSSDAARSSSSTRTIMPVADGALETLQGEAFAVAPVLEAVPMLQSPSHIDSPLNFVEYSTINDVNAASATRQQQLLQRKSRPEARSYSSDDDLWLSLYESSCLNLDLSDLDDDNECSYSLCYFKQQPKFV